MVAGVGLFVVEMMVVVVRVCGVWYSVQMLYNTVLITVVVIRTSIQLHHLRYKP